MVSIEQVKFGNDLKSLTQPWVNTVKKLPVREELQNDPELLFIEIGEQTALISNRERQENCWKGFPNDDTSLLGQGIAGGGIAQADLDQYVIMCEKYQKMFAGMFRQSRQPSNNIIIKDVAEELGFIEGTIGYQLLVLAKIAYMCDPDGIQPLLQMP